MKIKLRVIHRIISFCITAKLWTGGAYYTQLRIISKILRVSVSFVSTLSRFFASSVVLDLLNVVLVCCLVYGCQYQLSDWLRRLGDLQQSTVRLGR